MINPMDDELLDLVDEHDHVVGQEWRSVVRENRWIYKIRAVWLFLKNSQGQLWIPRRSAAKKTNPLTLDGSVVGAVGAGESYEQAVEREALEEIRLDIRGKYRYIGYCNPAEKVTLSHVKVYEMEYENSPDFNPADICEGYWLYPEEIIKKSQSGERVRSSLIGIMKKFYNS